MIDRSWGHVVEQLGVPAVSSAATACSVATLLDGGNTGKPSTETKPDGTHGADPISVHETAVTKPALLAGAGVIATVVGFAKRIEPLIELGVALVVMAMLTKPKPEA